MKKWISIVTTALAFILMGSSAYADNIKIGVVDMNQILQKSPLMISINNNLTKKFKPRQDELNNAKKNLQDEIDQLNLNGATMTTDARNKIQNQIIADKANVAVLAANLDRDVTIAKNQDVQTFMAKLSQVINKIAQDGHYDLIEQSTNMAFVGKNVDITQQILQQMT